MSQYDISGWEDLPSTTWPSLFAILGLAHIGQAFRVPFGGTHLTGDARELYLLEFTGELAADDMEVADFAEKQILADRFESAEQERKRKQSLQAQKAALERHRSETELKWEFIQFRIKKPANQEHSSSHFHLLSESRQR